MSELAARLDEARKTVTESQAKILTLDIERMKGSATIEFWDLGDYKNRRIHADDVKLWPRTICMAWNWYGEHRIEFSSEWGDGREGMLKRTWEAVDQADIVVGHNVAGFDLKRLNTEWRDIGLIPPSPYKAVDTLKEVRKCFGDESKTLDALNRRLGIAAKTDRYDVEVARAALEGDRVAQLQIQAYNEGDILASIALFDRLRGWLPNHPHLGPLDETEMRCNQCNSTDIERNGTYLAIQIRYIQYRCNTCGANLRGGTHSRAANVRGAR